jgi:hypothetical protein
MDRIALANSISDYEQRCFIKIGVLLNKSAKDIHSLLRKALQGRSYPLRSVQRWVADINSGRTSVEEARGGAHYVCPETDERVAAVNELLRDSKGWSVRELAHRLQIPKTAIHDILTSNLGLNKVLGKWVPHNLTEDQKDFRVISCRDNLLR